MGAQLDFVVDISRVGAPGLIAGKMLLGGDHGDGVEHSPRVSSSGTGDSSDGKADAGDVVDHEKGLHPMGGQPRRSPSNGNASKNVEASSNSSKVQGSGTPVYDPAAAYYASHGDGLGNFMISNGSSPDPERLMKNGGSRKRKKTVYYMNSRVPHAAPMLDNEEGWDDHDSPEEADDATLVRPSQAPRVAASKVGSQLPLGNCSLCLGLRAASVA
jgi:hypothetical protein